MDGHHGEEGRQDQNYRGGRPNFGGRGPHRGGTRGNPQDKRRDVEPKQREIQEAPNTAFVHTSGGVAVAAVLKHIEDVIGAGAIQQHYFKDRANFGFVQFSTPDVCTLSRTVVDGSKVTSAQFVVLTVPYIAIVERSRVHAKKPQHSPPPLSLSTSAENGSASPVVGTEQPVAAGTVPSVAATAAAATIAPPEPEKTNSLVVKNLPFQLKQEEFQEILDAFELKASHLKYHLDNGQFRGIAFIKYRTVEEATTIFERFQSFEIGGRRLRCEYKRKLPNQSNELDLDDDEAKALWEQLNRFKESTQIEHPFPASLTNTQRKQIHYFADRLGLLHYSQGEGEARFIVVTKRRDRQPQGSNTVGLQPADDKSWRARNQEEKKKASSESTVRILPVRQPKGPEPKGFSDEYRASRKLAPPLSPALPPAGAPPGSSSPATAKLSATAPTFQPKMNTPPVPHVNTAAAAPVPAPAGTK